MALMLSPDPIPVDVTAAVVDAAAEVAADAVDVVAAVDAAPDMVELI
jgi:hypothetical protein